MGVNSFFFFLKFFHNSYDFYVCLGDSHFLKSSPDVRQTCRKDAASRITGKGLGLEQEVSGRKRKWADNTDRSKQ